MAQPRYIVSTALPTSLAVACGASGNIQVAAMPGTWPAQYPYTILVDWGTTTEEAMSVTGTPTGTGPFTLPVTRGLSGTTAQAHALNAGVVHSVTYQDFLGSDQEFYLDAYQGSDDAKWAAALAAVQAAGSGTIRLGPRAHTFTGQWATAGGGSPYYLRVKGAGAGASTGDLNGTGATTCDMQYASTGPAKMDFRHSGAISLEDIAFTDTTGDAVPFFQSTNPSPKLRHLSFAGSKTLTACNQDAIYLGGNNLADVLTGNADAPFQGYQGVVEDVTFSGIRTGVACRGFANSISMRDLSFNNSCGSANVFSVTDAAMTASSATLTSATAAFNSGMVGQPVFVAGAGKAGVQAGWLSAVISAFTNSTTVTLSVAAHTTVTGAKAIAPAGFAVAMGNFAGGGVEGCMLTDSLIEVTGYPVAVGLYNSIGNAVTGTSFWDGATANVGSIWAGGFTSDCHFLIPTSGQATASQPPVLEDGPLSNVVISPTGPVPVVQFIQNVTTNVPGPLALPGSQVVFTDGLFPHIPPSGGGTSYWALVANAAQFLLDYFDGSALHTALELSWATNPAVWDLGASGSTAVWFRNLSGSLSVMALAGSAVNLGDSTRQADVLVQNGNLVVTHLLAQGTAPTAAADNSSTSVAIAGQDTAHKVSFTTEASLPAGSSAVTVTFGLSYATRAPSKTPRLTITPKNQAAAAAMAYVQNDSATGYDIAFATPPASATAMVFDVHVIAS